MSHKKNSILKRKNGKNHPSNDKGEAKRVHFYKYETIHFFDKDDPAQPIPLPLIDIIEVFQIFLDARNNKVNLEIDDTIYFEMLNFGIDKIEEIIKSVFNVQNIELDLDSLRDFTKMIEKKGKEYAESQHISVAKPH